LDVGDWRSSTKIEAPVEKLGNLRLKDTTTKSIVFSQFVTILITKAGFSASIYSLATIATANDQICRLEGTMSPQARDATIKHLSMVPV